MAKSLHCTNYYRGFALGRGKKARFRWLLTLPLWKNKKNNLKKKERKLISPRGLLLGFVRCLNKVHPDESRCCCCSLTLHPNIRDRVRLLQMTLHWHMTGERHFKFLTGRDISPKPSHQADSTRARRSAASHSEPRCNLDESRGSWRGRVGPVVPVNGRAAPLKREVYSCFICSFIFTFTLR